MLAPAALAVLVYANTLPNSLVYDDVWLISWLEGWSSSGTTHLGDRRALSFLVQSGERWLWGDWTPGFRLTSLLLHGLASALAAQLALRLSASPRVGLLCGLLFAVHPVHVEAVASLTNLSDVLAMIFVSLSLIVWVPAQRTPLRQLASLALLALGLYAKPVAAAGATLMLPLVDVLLASPAPGQPRRPLLRSLLRWAPFVALGLGVSYFYLGGLAAHFSAESIRLRTEGELDSYWRVVATSAASIPELFRLLFFPWLLSFDYPTRVQDGLAAPRALLGLAMISLWLTAAWALARRSPVATFAMLWVVVTYLPCSNLLPLTQFFVAERYLYVPSFGFCLLVAVAVDAAIRALGSERRSLQILLACAVAAILLAASARTLARNRDWRDSSSLAASALAAGIESRRVHHMLGEAAWKQRDFPKAVSHLSRSLETQPDVAWLRYDLASALVMDGKLDEAARQARIANTLVAPSPKARRSQLTLARVYLKQGMERESAAQLQRLLETAPDHQEARMTLAWLLATSHDPGLRDPEAARSSAEGMRSAGGLCALAAALAEAGDRRRALELASRARDEALRDGDRRTLRTAEWLLGELRADRAIRLEAAAILRLGRRGPPRRVRE